MTIICYTGIGARKDGDHTQEQFLNIMNDNKDVCSSFFKSKKCKPCKKYNTKVNKYFKQQMDKAKKEQKPGESPKLVLEKTFTKDKNMCEKCKNTNLKPCSLKEYIEYTGAEMGSCKDLTGGSRRKASRRKASRRKASRRKASRR